MPKTPYLIVHNGARIFGGCERWTVTTLAALVERGHSIKLICIDAIVADRARARGIETEILPLGGDAVLHHALRLARVLRREQPDVVLFTTFRKIWLGTMATRLARVPRTIMRIGLSSDVPRNFKYHIALRAIDQTIVNAPNLAPLFTGDVVTIPNGVAVPGVTIDRAAFRAASRIPDDAFLVGTLARLVVQKRLDRLIDALTLLPAHVHAVVAGEGELREDLERQAAQKNVGDRLHLIGHREDVGNVLNALDTYVVCSDREGMSNALLEAMALGLPAISTPVSGAAFALDAGGEQPAGVVLTSHEAGELAQAVATLLHSPELRARLGANARRRHEQHFSLTRMIDDYECLLFH